MKVLIIFGSIEVLTKEMLCNSEQQCAFSPQVREGFHIEFRAEAFNLLNHPMFQVPSRASLAIFNASRASVTSQILTSTSAPERQIQFGLNLIF